MTWLIREALSYLSLLWPWEWLCLHLMLPFDHLLVLSLPLLLEQPLDFLEELQLDLLLGPIDRYRHYVIFSGVARRTAILAYFLPKI